MMTLDGKLHLAPIGNNIHNCLDVGTGTGIWATDFGDYIQFSGQRTC
jgi:ubiquinone/menaquinone biosynthesis C-methylase UbiE